VNDAINIENDVRVVFGKSSIFVEIHPLNLKIMGNLLYTVAVILVIAWAIGFIGFHVGGIIHLLLVIAVIAVLLRVISGNRVA
jgi:Family of unknown function (DUF5670)